MPPCHRLGLVLLLALSPREGFSERTLLPLARDEIGIWETVREERSALERSGFLLGDPAVTAYVQGVQDALARAEGFAPGTFEIRILRDPTLNAFAYPDGGVYLHTGLLARLQNEAQLAAILGHEMTHAIARHTWKSHRSLKTKTGLLAVLATGASAAGDFRSVVELLGTFGAHAAISGHSKSLETEADAEGWRIMHRCGYDTNAAPEVFRILMADLAAHRRPEPFFFGTHPRLAERERNFEQHNRALRGATAGELHATRYQAGILPVLLVNGEAEMRAGRHVAARDQLWRFRAADPLEVRVRWLLAENERLAGPDGDLLEARRLLGEALAMDEGFAPARRTLGIVLYRAGELAEAAPHLRRFLELEPFAHDRAFIQSYLDKCPPDTSSQPAS